MITFRPFEPEKDFPMLQSWWKRHGVQEVPKLLLVRGWIAEGAGLAIAASFLYLDPKNIAMIEWTTTNPQCSFSRDSLEAVKGLYRTLEAAAKEAGCLAIFSLVKPNGSEQRIMSKMGYAASSDDVGHLLYAKPLIECGYKVPEGGVEQCPS